MNREWRCGHPPRLRLWRMNNGTSLDLLEAMSQKPHFSQRTREMGHPAYSRDESRMEMWPPAEVVSVADEQWHEPGLIGSYEPKAPLLAKNARNGAPSLFKG